METATVLVEIATGYLIVGAVVGAAFLAIGIDRVEPSAEVAYAFRPLLVPGLCLIWPLVLWRWLALERQKRA